MIIRAVGLLLVVDRISRFVVVTDVGTGRLAVIYGGAHIRECDRATFDAQRLHYLAPTGRIARLR